MNNAVPYELVDLVDELLRWTATMPTRTFYMYGSRARGDHHAESDIDICFDAENANALDTIELQLQEIDGRFDLPAKYHGLVRDQSKRWPELRERIRAAPVRYRKGNIVCVDLPPAPRGDHAIQVFRGEKGWTDEWLQLNDNGSFTLTVSSPEVRRRGSSFDTVILTEREARGRFPDRAPDIDRAIEELARRRASN